MKGPLCFLIHVLPILVEYVKDYIKQVSFDSSYIVSKFLFQGECKGFRDVLKTYTRVTPTVKLHRPTNFAPLIYKAIEIIQNTGKVCVFTEDEHVRC